VKAKVTWKQRMSFTGTGESGFEVPLGTDAGVGGDEDGFRPMELFATALAGCTAMDVISILRKKSQDVTAFEVQVHAARAEEHPRVFIRAMIEYFITGHAVEAAAVVRAIELSATRYCPAQAMFAKVFPMDLKYHIYEQDANGGTKLVKSGVYSVPSRIEAG
jgi:putative redox protein